MDIYKFLSASQKNVVSIHCLAGKGRTGTVICCYLLFSGLFADKESALNFFAMRRSRHNWGVTGPSQRRYIGYFERIWFKRVRPHHTSLILTKLTFSRVPWEKRTFTPIVTIHDMSDNSSKPALIYS
ncbi:MAG: hypothetical protein CUN57_02800, partial [Phototrophicales bacterium]